MNDVHRVVVTGLGAITPLGATADAYWANLKQGASGISPIDVPMAEQLSQKVAAQIKGFDPLKYFDDRQLSMLDRASQFAVISARERPSIPSRWR